MIFKNVRMQCLEGDVSVWVSRGELDAWWESNVNFVESDVVEYN